MKLESTKCRDTFAVATFKSLLHSVLVGNKGDDVLFYSRSSFFNDLKTLKLARPNDKFSLFQYSGPK